MDGDLLSLAMEVMQAVNSTQETNFGPITETNIQVKMNDIDEEAGVGIKGQLLLAGPALNEVKEDGSTIFPDKADDDLFFVVSIKTKGDPQEAIDEIKGMIEAFGLPMDMVAQFAELKFHAGDGEMHIGIKANDNPYTDMAKGFVVNSSLFGDGTQDVTIDLSVNLGTTFNDMLGEEPLFTNFLKSASVHLKASMHDKTRENVVNILAEKKEQLEPLINMFPFIMPIFLFKKLDSILELQCTDEMKQQMIDTATNLNPMAVMSLNEVFQMVKMAGIPLELFQPILELVSNRTAGEVQFSGIAGVGFKFTLRLPGLDQAITQFLSS
jgi:hypothetical protein